jgi:hypothetical protein
MRLLPLEPAAPWNGNSKIQPQCVKCKGFSRWDDAVASGWRRDLDSKEKAGYVCGVCLHDIEVSDNLQKLSPRK